MGCGDLNMSCMKTDLLDILKAELSLSSKHYVKKFRIDRRGAFDFTVNIIQKKRSETIDKVYARLV
jgi:hypothetical protein